MAALIELTNVTKQFGDLTVIRDFSGSLAQAEIISLVGPSGCGKSTLLRLVAGVETPDAGQVHRRVLPEKIGFVFQDACLLPWQSALHNVTFVLQDRIADKHEREARAMAALARVELADFADYRPAQLSGGMQKRVAIARALVIDPDLMLLDEPFSDLDLPLRLILIEDIRRMLTQGGKTAIYVTHDIREALILSDRIFVLSARPTTVRKVITLNGLHASKHQDGVLTPDLIAIEQKVITMLGQETRRQREQQV
jgi:NitT/TauT family transport system ATP-binding protein